MTIGGHAPLTWQIWHGDGTQYDPNCPECNDFSVVKAGPPAISRQDAVWQAIDDIYTLALNLENQDPQLLAPLVEKLAALWKQKPRK